eukprot:TRINITY_DN11536_c0_g1_i1.p1 TRINITY_DN11536_c0_g1~~TRINITY_DN11536_c0_g1_i1.p1  ORF type:complete len:769 (+),score=98.67 TRINITY_DN11536_c0_g1_i1:91-2397(+)
MEPWLEPHWLSGGRAPLLRLPDLECDTPALGHWAPLRIEAIAAASLAEPPEALLSLAAGLVSDAAPDIELLVGFMGGHRDDDTFPFHRYCLLGHITAVYVVAWMNAIQDQTSQALRLLRTAEKMLRMETNDLFDDTSWPFNSWDLACNVHALSSGGSFMPKWARPQPSVDVGQRLPLVWPPFAPRCWPLSDGGCDNAGLQTSRKRRLAVWWTSKHPSPFADIVAILEEFMSEKYEVRVESHAVSEYCTYAKYRDWLCSDDARLKESVLRHSYVLSHQSQAVCGEERGQFCGAQDLHAEFDHAVETFDRIFGDHFAAKIDIALCGHPLYWCRLFERTNTPVVGVWDMSHHFSVPKHMQEAWHGQFLNMFRNPQNVLVAWGGFHSFQAQWILGSDIRVPYWPPIAIKDSLEARYMPVKNDSVLFSVFNTPYEPVVIERLAQIWPDAFPLKFVQWRRDLPSDILRRDLAQYRAVVLCPYDTGNLKLAEFYAMQMPMFVRRSGLWRTTMRWSKASDKEAGKNASLPGRLPHLRDTDQQHSNADVWARVVARETSRVRWEQPWRLAAGGGTNSIVWLGCYHSSNHTALDFRLHSHHGDGAHTGDGSTESCASFCNRRGGLMILQNGFCICGSDAEVSLLQSAFGRKCGRVCEHEELLDPIRYCGTARRSAVYRLSDSVDLPFAPYTVRSERFQPAGAAFWSQLTEWNLFPHLLYYDSAGHLLQLLHGTSQSDLDAVSKRMASHHAKMQVAVINFWRALVSDLVEHRRATRWRT